MGGNEKESSPRKKEKICEAMTTGTGESLINKQ
jgi:hypothetical protein